MIHDEPFAPRKLPPEEVERGLAAIDQAQQHAKEILARRGGKLFPNSSEIIHEMREERTRQLMEALGWDDLR